MSVHHAGRIRPGGREAEGIRAVETTSRPGDVAHVDVGVVVEEGELLADVLDARGGVAAARLRHDGLAVVLAQPRGERGEGRVDVVGGALGAGARVVRVEVPVDSGSQG